LIKNTIKTKDLVSIGMGYCQDHLKKILIPKGFGSLPRKKYKGIIKIKAKNHLIHGVYESIKGK
jgi:hypothetical protein